MIDIEVGSANVYADLGRSDAEEMLVKAQLASKIGDIIKRRKWTQARAAEVLGIPQPKLSGLTCFCLSPSRGGDRAAVCSKSEGAGERRRIDPTDRRIAFAPCRFCPFDGCPATL
jgi:hypothetical protein